MGIPKHFKTLDQDVTRKLLEGQEDILSSEVDKRESIYRGASCPSCNSKNLSVKAKDFNPNELVPYHHLECEVCGCIFDPKTKLILKDGLEIINSDLDQ